MVRGTKGREGEEGEDYDGWEIGKTTNPHGDQSPTLPSPPLLKLISKMMNNQQDLFQTTFLNVHKRFYKNLLYTQRN